MTGEVEKSKLVKKQFKMQPCIHGKWVSRHRGVMQGCAQASWIINSLWHVHGVHQSVLNTNVVLAVNTTDQTHMWRSWRSNPAMVSSRSELVWPVFAWEDLSSYGCCLLFAWSDACVIWGHTYLRGMSKEQQPTFRLSINDWHMQFGVADQCRAVR